MRNEKSAMRNDNKPKIRFANFNDNWEVRKFGETVLIERGGSPRPIDAYITNDPQGLNWVKIGDAPKQGNYITKTEEKIIPQGLSKTREVKAGDLILSNSMSFGKPYIMAINGCIHDGWLLIRNTANVFNLQFLCVLLGTDNMLNQYKSFAAGSTVNNLNKELVGNTIISLPAHDEQTKIGEYFSQLDELINLYKRKLEKSINFKKAMLEKMFPAMRNDNKPKIRFANFNDNWEVRKYEDLGTAISGGNLSYSDLDENGKNKCILYGELYTRYDFIIKDIVYRTNKNAINVRKNDILFPQSTTVDAISLISPACMNEDKAETSGVFIIRPYNDIDGNFVVYYTKGNSFQRYKLSTKAQGLTIIHLYYQSIKDEIILIPKFDEQKKISQYFSQFDELINLYKRKLEKSINFKKAMLEKMFPAMSNETDNC